MKIAVLLQTKENEYAVQKNPEVEVRRNHNRMAIHIKHGHVQRNRQHSRNGAIANRNGKKR
jgi:hypothetical protein